VRPRRLLAVGGPVARRREGFAKATELAVGKRRVFWISGARVYSRPFGAGRARREALAAHLRPGSLDSDGTTLAVVGDLPGEFAGGATGVWVTRVGSGKARLRAARSYSEEYAGFRIPVVTARGVTTLFDHFTFTTSTSFAELGTGKTGWNERGTAGIEILTWDADGDRAVFVEGPSDAGYAIGNDYLEQIVERVPCRIPLADPSGERLMPPRISIVKRVATVAQAKVRGRRVIVRAPLAGVAVEVRESGKVVATLTTDAQGKVTLPEGESGDGLAVQAATTPLSYAYYSG